jgi:hypothetical protein
MMAHGTGIEEDCIITLGIAAARARESAPGSTTAGGAGELAPGSATAEAGVFASNFVVHTHTGGSTSSSAYTCQSTRATTCPVGIPSGTGDASTPRAKYPEDGVVRAGGQAEPPSL